MEKRFIVFLVISFAIMIAYPFFIEKLGLVKPPSVPAETETNPPPQETKPGPTARSEDRSLGPETSGAALEEKTIVVNTDLYRAEFNSRGGKLTMFELKKYAAEDHATRVRLYEGSADHTHAFSVQTDDPEFDDRLDRGLYFVEGGDLDLKDNHPTGTVEFRYVDGKTGAEVRKRFVFTKNNYLIEMDIETKAFPERYRISLGTDFGIRDWGKSGRFVGFIGPITLANGELLKDSPSKMEGEKRHEGTIAWTALQDKYFIAAAIPTGADAAVVSTSGPMEVNSAVEFKSAGSAPVTSHVLIYAGPKEHARLQALGVKLEETVDFGWFIYGSWAIVRFIARPLFYVLEFFHGFTGNYGVSIILLTVGVRVLFIPLSHKSYRSMKDMQALQPQLQALQKKYKDDKPRLQREMMELYQKQKVNPLGGCLPMVLQIPVFVALFNVLYTTIEIRQAPFIFWIHDLSDKDPYYVLPILMGLTMLIQQKLQPTTMDPTQAKLFLMMPVLMTFLFLNFSSGLVLYMLTNNVLTVTQQYFTMKYFEKAREKELDKTEPEKAPATERKRR
jgi:YidC/Oxa1 family membrane protein insertase